MIRVGIKYCGGCNPEYDRVALVDKLKRRLTGRVEFTSWESNDIDMVLAVEGCSAACADLRSMEHLKIFVITEPADGEQFINWMASK